jgi:hypothetical protein
MKRSIYKADEIFKPIEGDPDNCLMEIPEEIRIQLGWEVGDILTIKLEDGSIIVSKNE